MIKENRWNLLKEWLLRDWWSPIEACHIFVLLVRTEQNQAYGSRAILSEHRRRPELMKELEERAESYLRIWNKSIHKPADGEYYRSSISNEFYTKEYCVKWAQKKSIKMPWLDWAIEEKLIILEDKQLKDIQDLKAAASDKPMGNKKEANLLRLISIMTELMVDAELKSTFSSASQMISYITENYKDIEPEQSGLSKKSLDVVLQKARRIRPID